jgi:hypothetical protein
VRKGQNYQGSHANSGSGYNETIFFLPCRWVMLPLALEQVMHEEPWFS